MTDNVEKRSAEARTDYTIILIGLIIAFGIFVGYRSPEAMPVDVGCKVDWTKCIDNSEMANNYDGWFHAKSDCKQAASKLAKYGTPEFSWPTYFSAFLKGNDYASNGIAVLYENDAKFQNGFGAMAHVDVRCEYDLRAKKVLNVRISQN